LKREREREREQEEREVKSLKPVLLPRRRNGIIQKYFNDIRNYIV